MKTMMLYKGYSGSASFDEEGLVFYGKIEFIRALVTFEATEAKALRDAFHEAVEDYLVTCADLGVAPEEPFKGSLNVRLGKPLHRAIASVAAQNDLSINAYIKNALEYYVQHQELLNTHG